MCGIYIRTIQGTRCAVLYQLLAQYPRVRILKQLLNRKDIRTSETFSVVRICANRNYVKCGLLKYTLLNL
jgi:hypothetical protein